MFTKRILILFFICFFARAMHAEVTQTPPDQKEAPAKELPQLEKTPPFASPDLQDVTETYENTFIKTIVVLVGLLALVILTVWMFKKISHGRLRTFSSSKTIKILEKRPLSPKSMLYLIEVNEKQVLMAESQLEVKQIMTFDGIAEQKDL